MIANPDIPCRSGAPDSFTLNDLRVQTIVEEPSRISALTVAGLALAAGLAIGGVIWLDPLQLFTRTEASAPTQAFVPSTEPARPAERQEIVATTVPATKSVEAPVAPAPVARTPEVAAPVVQPRASSGKPEARGGSPDNKHVTVARAPKESAAPPVLLSKPEATTAPSALPIETERTTAPPVLTKPEQTTDAPIGPKVGDDTRNAPKPAVANDQVPAPE